MHALLPRALGLAALGLLALGTAAPGALAQNAATNAYVIRDYVDDVKLPDGSMARWHVAITYDPVSGETVRTVTDEAGTVLERTATDRTLTAPSADEIAAAEALVRADPEVAALIAAARNPIVQGGFILLREEGHPCGPGSRCLQFDVVNADEEARRVDRLRYVVVDLRAGRVVSNDFAPGLEGNARRPEDAR